MPEKKNNAFHTKDARARALYLQRFLIDVLESVKEKKNTTTAKDVLKIIDKNGYTYAIHNQTYTCILKIDIQNNIYQLMMMSHQQKIRSARYVAARYEDA